MCSVRVRGSPSSTSTDDVKLHWCIDSIFGRNLNSLTLLFQKNDGEISSMQFRWHIDGDEDWTMETTMVMADFKWSITSNKSHSLKPYSFVLLKFQSMATHNQTIGSGSPPRLPSLLSRSSVYLSKSGWILRRISFDRSLSLSSIETPLFKRRRGRQKDNLNASTSKIERQGTSLVSQTRLPPLNTTSNDPTLRQRADFQRRQVRISRCQFYSLLLSLNRSTLWIIWCAN